VVIILGSYITLGIEGTDIDFEKNFSFRDHSKLFLPADKKKIPYVYGDEIIQMRDGYARVLSSVKNRLDLLGYSMKSVEEKYNQFLFSVELYSVGVKIPFEIFHNVVYNIDIKEASVFDQGEYDLIGFWGYLTKQFRINLEFKKFISTIEDEDGEYQSFYYLDEYFERIDPYIIIRIIAENPINHTLELNWKYRDIVENGWVAEESIFKGLSNKDKILIVTEGSSDSFIIKRSIDDLYPDISDFFEFVDMEENYPFTGVGNLFKFLKGLISIGVQNNIIFIFDNDIAGNEIYSLALGNEKPNNIVVIKLPYCTEFENFETIGPSGLHIVNINDKAVAIECFLDFTSVGSKPLVRWTSYSKKLNEYQGELVKKDSYVKAFKKANLLGSNYDTEKLRKLIDYLLEKWVNN